MHTRMYTHTHTHTHTHTRALDKGLYNGNCSQKKMIANFANPGASANIFLLNFHFFNYYSCRGEGIASLNIQ